MTVEPNSSEDFQPIDPEKPYRTGQSPERDAWYTAFFLENHLDYYAYPDKVATPEKERFMVYTEADERYYPCSDRMFAAIMNRMRSYFLQDKYNEALQQILSLVDRQIESDREKAYLHSLLMIKYKHETRDEIMIPSRLEKRLFKIFLNQTQIEDPCIYDKTVRNLRASEVLTSPAFRTALNHFGEPLAQPAPETLIAMRNRINRLQFQRYLLLAADHGIWKTEVAGSYTTDNFNAVFKRPIKGNGMDPMIGFLGMGEDGKPGDPKKILWLADESGEILVDLAMIRFLADRGHKIILAFKDGPFYTKVTFSDCRNDQVLRKHLEDMLWITDKALSKNELLDILRSDNRIFIISDGTRENLNLLLATTTFARIFREVDGVISRGIDQKRRLFYAHFQFTQDIFNISGADDGTLVVDYKPRDSHVIKFSHRDLEKKADTIVEQIQAAKRAGQTVMFYSGIIGSIPGKIPVAKKVMSTTVEHLKKQSARTFIINPSEHFEPGMDADDLMYMWEIVQRSGYIDIWRFQTYDDIVNAFEIMEHKVPPEWVGKDATYSTGCTKEMKIALNVQQKHPEMQIIGPDREKFMRRADYGIGRMYDKRLAREQ